MGNDGAARWQARFNARYGVASWPHAVTRARIIYCWHSVKEQDAQPQASGWERSFQEQTLCAVMLWRTARAQSRSIDDVTMTDVAATCRSAITAGGLDSDRMPTIGEGYGMLPTPEDTVAVLEAVEQRLLEHADPPLTPPSSRRDRVRYVILGLLADPEAIYHLGGGWATAQSVAQQHMTIVKGELYAGMWHVTRAVHHAVHATGLAGSEPPAYDYPATPTAAERSRPSWLQRASWLAGLAPSLRAAANTLPPTERGTVAPLGVLLTSYAGMCGLLTQAVETLDRRWAAELTLPSTEWEAANVPPALERQTTATEEMIDGLRVFLSRLLDIPA